METKKHEQSVKESYGKFAKNKKKESLISNLCPLSKKDQTKEYAQEIGYNTEQLQEVPDDANMGLGCGNPLALSHVKKGDTVLDLGSGAGFDCFLALPLVGENGKVIGIDFTPEMVEKAKLNAQKSKYKNVEFILSNIDNIPLQNNTVDHVISNCVINLASNMQKVFEESYRVLKIGGHLSISDIVLTKDLPERISKAMLPNNGLICLNGAANKETFLQMLAQAGYKNVQIMKESHFPLEIMLADPMVQTIVTEAKLSDSEVSELFNTILSVSFYAEK
jgi:SAM-dependent methyltransferase